MKDRFEKTLLKMIENIFYFLRLCNSTYNKQTYIWVFNLYNMIYHSCCMLIFFFFFAQLVVTLPPFFFQKCYQYKYILFPIYQAYFWLLLKKKKLFMCVVYAFKVSMKKNNALDFKNVENKTKSSKIKVRFGILRAIF